MLRYICINFLFFLLASSVLSQNNAEELLDFSSYDNRAAKGFTLGVNLASPVNHLLNNDRMGVSFFTRVNIMEDWFFMGEVGYENVSFKKEEYDYDSNGTFLKVGLETDLLSNKKSARDNILMGFQYGVAIQEQSASHFFVDNGYWEDLFGSIPSETIHTHWLEVSAGPHTEMFKNFFIGWKVHLRASIINGGQDIMKPYIVPGFGNGGNRINGGFSYTLEYMIPWKK